LNGFLVSGGFLQVSRLEFLTLRFVARVESSCRHLLGYHLRIPQPQPGGWWALAE
jgi:hypothetical protein